MGVSEGALACVRVSEPHSEILGLIEGWGGHTEKEKEKLNYPSAWKQKLVRRGLSPSSKGCGGPEISLHVPGKTMFIEK